MHFNCIDLSFNSTLIGTSHTFNIINEVLNMLDMEEKIFILIFSKKVRVTDIVRFTGLNESMLYKLRRGERQINNLTIMTGRKLEKCYDECEKQGEISENDFKIALQNARKSGVQLL